MSGVKAEDRRWHRRLPSRPVSPAERGGIRERWRPVHAVDRLIGVIAVHKVEMLTGAIVVAGVLVAATVGTFLIGDGEWMTHQVLDLGGYVAILATVLGIPALCYAMVTDRAIDALSAATFENMTRALAEQMTHVVSESFPAHHVQLFRPNAQGTRLVTAYDPGEFGPAEGWDINPATPQALTGSAWVTRKYYWAVKPELALDAHRLTPEQRDRFSDLTGVAAAPVKGRNGEPAAVLTILTKSDDPQIASKEFQDLHIALAERLSHDFQLYSGPLDYDSITPVQASEHRSGSFAVSETIVAAALASTQGTVDHLDAAATSPSG